MADTGDLKSPAHKACGFESRHQHGKRPCPPNKPAGFIYTGRILFRSIPANLLDKTPHIEENETNHPARAKRVEEPPRHLAKRESRGPKALRRSPEGSALWRGSPRGSAPWASHAQSVWRNLSAISRNGSREGRRPFEGVQRAAPSGGVPQGAAPLGLCTRQTPNIFSVFFRETGVERAEGPSQESRGQRPLAGFPKGQRPLDLAG